jgi:arylsulfatase A-like enzyme
VQRLMIVFAALSAALPVHAAELLALDRSPDGVVLDLPDGSRESIPERVPVSGPWVLVGTVSGVRTWEAPLPVRPRTLFFHRAPDDMAVYKAKVDGDGSRRLRHAAGLEAWGRADSWSFTSKALRVRRAAASGPPGPDEYRVRYTRAVEREQTLNLEESGLEPLEFAFRSVQVDDTTRHGVLLPAPGSATWNVRIPAGGVLDLDTILIPPEAADPVERSDGASLEVAILDEGGRHLLATAVPKLGVARSLRVDLGDWGGRDVQLELRSGPGDDPFLDYVFIADPVIFVPAEAPARVVLVFVDTLRADHLSILGYERETTPGLDAFFADGAVFEQARSIAPWTLPSTRTMITGAIPERWGHVPTLQERFGDAGWATAFLAGNVYLSSNFEMADGWGTHRVINWPNADVQIDRALDFLDENPDRPAFLMLHLMDMHLPYTEPLAYRSRFAGERPEELDAVSFQRGSVVSGAKTMGESGKQYVRDRYDNNLAFVDDQLMRFFEALGPNDTVLLVSDHGEEFWDHGGFEHGHTLHDELLRVPMLWKGPGLTGGRFSEPTSLLDVAPTLATVAGLSTEGMTGLPLQTLVSGEATAEFADRPQAFGRPLYGQRRWGGLDHGQKYVTSKGKDALYDLAADPDEADSQFQIGDDMSSVRASMSEALGQPVRQALRLYPTRNRSKDDLIVEVVVEGGVDGAFVAQDPTMKSEANVVVDGDRVRAVWPGGKNSTREVFIVPTLPVEEAAAGLSWTIAFGSGIHEFGPDKVNVKPFDGSGATLARLQVPRRSVTVTWATVPMFDESATQLAGFDDEVRGELEVLGYVDAKDEGAEETPKKDGDPSLDPDAATPH